MRPVILALCMMLLVGCHQQQSRAIQMRAKVAMLQSVTTSTGQEITIPPPVLWPVEAMDTRDFRSWSKRGNIQQLEYVSLSGMRYVGNFESIYTKPDEAQPYAHISKVTRYRKDGTKDAMTTYSGSGNPDTWTYYRADGTLPVIQVHQTENADDSIRIDRVVTFDDNGAGEAWRITSDGRAIAQ